MATSLHTNFETDPFKTRVTIVTDTPERVYEEAQQLFDFGTMDESGINIADYIKDAEIIEVDTEKNYFEIDVGMSAAFDSFDPPIVSDCNVTLDFYIYNEQEERFKDKVASVTIKDTSGIYSNAPRLTVEECRAFAGFPIYQFLSEQQRSEITPSVRAALDAGHILSSVFCERLTSSKIPYEEKKKFFVSVSERTIAGLTRQDHTQRERTVLRGQKGSEGSTSFKKAVKTFAERQVTRLIRKEHEIMLIRREDAHNICDDLIIAHATPRTLAGALKTELKKKSRDEKTIFIARIQEAAKAAAIDNDSGNGFAALASMLSIQRGLRYSLEHRKKAATEKEDHENTAEHVQWNKQNVETKDIIIPAGANLDEGYFPCGLESDCFAIYADVVLDRINMSASYENIVETENELHKMAGVKLTSKTRETQASVSNYNFLSSRQKDETPGKRGRAIWMIWNLSSAFNFPEPVPRNRKFSFQTLDPNMYAEINRLAKLAGLHRPTIGLLNKTAFLIHSQMQTQIDGDAARAKKAERIEGANGKENEKQAQDVQKITRIEIKRSKLPLPEDRRARDSFLSVLAGALKAVGIEFAPEGKDFTAAKLTPKAVKLSSDKG